MRYLFFVAGLTVSVVASGSAHAQEASASSETLQSAANAFDHGTAAMVAGRYVEAAELFETAYHLVPRAPALIQAMRAHGRAGNHVRACTLALIVQQRYAADTGAVTSANNVLRAYQQRVARIDVSCEACTVQVDGSLQELPSFFVLPSVSHRVVAHFSDGRSAEALVNEPARSTRALTLTPPVPETDTVPASATAPVATTPANSTAGATSTGLSPVYFYVTAGATAVSGGLLIWSGIDANAGVDAYEANPTQEALDAGQAKEARTNALIATTAVLAAGTLALAFFTDFGSHDRSSSSPTASVGVAPIPNGAAAFVHGSF